MLAVTERGAVLLLDWKAFHALLPIGADFESLDWLEAERRGALAHLEALLLAENGYAPANPPGLIARLRPQVALLSVAPGDRQGMPDPETLQALEGYTLLRTDRNGWIEITTDGEQMCVEVGKR